MRLFLVSTAYNNRLSKVTAETLVLARWSVLIGTGPGCHYVYSHMVAAQRPPTDMGDDRLNAAAFGRGPEPTAVTVTELTIDRAVELLDRRQVGEKGTIRVSLLPAGPCWQALPGYRTHDGDYACEGSGELVEKLSSL